MTIREILASKVSSDDVGDALVILTACVVVVLYATGVVQ